MPSVSRRIRSCSTHSLLVERGCGFVVKRKTRPHCHQWSCLLTRFYRYGVGLAGQGGRFDGKFGRGTRGCGMGECEICRCSGTGGTTVHLLMGPHSGSSTSTRNPSLHEAFRLHEEKALTRKSTLGGFNARQKPLARTPWRRYRVGKKTKMVTEAATHNVAIKLSDPEDKRSPDTSLHKARWSLLPFRKGRRGQCNAVRSVSSPQPLL
jgi:hypothetical protein